MGSLDAQAANAEKQNARFQQLVASQEAQSQAISDAFDQVRLLIIQNTSDPNLAQGLLDQMGQQDPIQKALSNQLHGLAAISQSKANELAQRAANQRSLNQLATTQGGIGQKSLTAAAIAGSFSACRRDPVVSQYEAECNAGSAASCYRAAAALCQCGLSKGASGNEAQELQQCVAQNTQDASSVAGP
jgi:hypothetical protein